MRIEDAQREVRSVYLGGFPGLLVSSMLWSVSAALATWGATRPAILVLVFGGALIHPVAQFVLRLMGGPSSINPRNPMRQLAVQSAYIIPLCLPVVAAATLYNRNWFYPALMIVVGAHYFPFAFLYGMPQYMLLGGAMVAAGVAAATALPHSFATAGWLAAALFFLAAFPFRWIAQRSLIAGATMLVCILAPLAAQSTAPSNDLPQRGESPHGKVLMTLGMFDQSSTTPDHSGAEGVGVDAHANVYGAVVGRQMLERHVPR